MEAHGDSVLVLTIRRDRLLRMIFVVCLGIEFALVILDFYGNYTNLDGPSPLRRLFSLAREDSLGGWLSVTQMTLVACTAWLIVLFERARGAARRGPWIVVACFLTYLALDDGAQVHERMGTVFSLLAGGSGGTSPAGWLIEMFPSYTWQVIYVPIFAALGIYTARLLWVALAPDPARVWAVVTLVAWAAAVGLDFFEGLDPDHPWNLHEFVANALNIRDYAETRFGVAPFTAVGHFQRVLEETIEMVGTTFLWAALVAHLTRIASGVRVKFS